MTNFNDRERAEEAKYAIDEDTQFRVTARRNRLLGQWAAEQMGLSAVEAEAYAKAVGLDIDGVVSTLGRQLSPEPL